MCKYNVEINLEADNTSHTKIIKLVGSGKKVLEFGCATGYMSRVLTEQFGCEVTGVEIDTEAAEQARQYCKRVVVGDAEAIDYDEVLGSEQFDVIIFADVLEHLVDPFAVLERVRKFFNPDGYLLISVPNIAHAAIVFQLLQGRFDYQPEGLLDDTHRQFFTKQTIIELLERSGYFVELIDRTILPAPTTEFRTDLRAFPSEVAQFVAEREDASVYQFIIKAIPTTESSYVLHLRHQLTEARHQAANQVKLIQELQSQIAERNAALESFHTRVSEQESAMRQLQEQITDKDAVISSSQAQIAPLAEQIQKLQCELSDQDKRVASLSMQVARQQKRGQHLKSQLADQQATIASLNARLSQYKEQIQALEAQVVQQQQLLWQEEVANEQLRRVHQEIEASLAWKIVVHVFWPSSGFLIPRWIRTSSLFRMVRRGTIILLEEGWRALWQKAKGVLRRHFQSNPQAITCPQPKQLGVPAIMQQSYHHEIGVQQSFVLDLRGIQSPEVQIRPINVIICVHNALDHVRQCLESVIEFTDLEKHRIIIIDDASTEQGITEYLEEMTLAFPDGIKVLTNTQRCGFVRSCNRAMRLSDRDVVLLNSDTVVARGWLDKLAEAAYSDERIATVTPFSNHATICSIPEFCQRNSVPEGFTIDSFATLIERISIKSYPEIPTGVGFCMYIKRQALDEIGYFDEETFGIGYGEEVDFCFRALEVGYRHVIDDVTYVYHHGGASFGEGVKIQSEADSTAKLWKLYDKRMATVQEFVQQNPLQATQDFIKYMSSRLIQDQGKTSVLYVSPYSFDTGLGGSILHTLDLVNYFKKQADYQVYVMYPLEPPEAVGEGFCLDRYTEAGVDRFVLLCDRHVDPVFYRGRGYPVPTGKLALSNPPAPLKDPQVEQMFEYILQAFDIDLVHFQHFLGGYPLSLIDICQAANVRQLLTIHDFYFFCHNFNLFENPQKVFCNYSTDDMRCYRCLSHHWRVDFGYQRRRREEINRWLPKLDRIIVPSSFLYEKSLELHPTVRPEQVIVIEHGTPFQPAISLSDSRSTVLRNGVLNVAFVGIFDVQKGSRVFKELVRIFDQNSNIRWFIFGDTWDQESLEQAQAAAPINVIGRYARETLPHLLREHHIDLALLLSPWPETYSYTLSEMIVNDIPVIGFDVGALGERIRSERAGFVVSLDDGAEGIAQVLQRTLVNPELLDVIGPRKKPDSVQENARRYDILYKEILQVAEGDDGIEHSAQLC